MDASQDSVIVRSFREYERKLTAQVGCVDGDFLFIFLSFIIIVV